MGGNIVQGWKVLREMAIYRRWLYKYSLMDFLQSLDWGVPRLLALNADVIAASFSARNFGRRTRAIRGPARRTHCFITQ